MAPARPSNASPMTFFSVLCALILEQFRALSRDNPIYDIVRALAARAEEWFDTGQRRDAVLAWGLVTLPAVVVVALVHYLLSSISIALAFLWNVLMVYLTLGFRQFSHYFTDIHEALRRDDLTTARLILSEWSGRDTADMPVNEIVRHTLECAIVAVHRHVFGVFFWFLVPIGPAGVVLYRGAEYLARHWSEQSMDRSPVLGLFARQAFRVIDYVPARLTAIGFAIVGDFEDAVYAWRNLAAKWNDEVNGILLAAGGGALGVRLGVPIAQRDSAERIADEDSAYPMDVGQEPSVRTLQSAVGLVWRAVVLWMLLLAMLSFAVWLG
uniref:Cobalamin biosynthesis protein CobD n=2 Tax=Ralstonia TaxID=48736 RepID=A0A0S4UMU6_RALSL|nr:Cobalamin biosynthesis protein CobD [Ralstonia solanacearum]CUV33095.1 Cobalamin biosynthesis protein CobD [Ralstonia solanacearum]CUV38698.1 Cobalamin biosynthesis protein CobD [Ralstonia solanacearum]CUV61292.1 Cobalamin biosynthesis protein CobD [Ralstonia solanacearum]